MIRQKKAAELREQGGQSKASTTTNDYSSSNLSNLVSAKRIDAIYPLTPIECRTTKKRVPNHLTHYGTINRFEASRILCCSTLNSTKVKRYSLADVSSNAALKLLKHWRVAS